MKKVILLLILGFWTCGQCAFGQVTLLRDFDFGRSGYQLLILPAGYGAPQDGSEIKYIDDAATLARFKQEFVFDAEPPHFRSRCEADFILHVCSQGISQETIEIDLRCRAISSSKGRFLYDGFLQLQAAKPARRQVDAFPDLLTARHMRDSLAHLPGLIYLEPPAWDRFEGTFDFYQENDMRPAEQVQAALQAEIAKAYPDEPFELEVRSAGGSTTEGWDYHCEVTCNRALYDQFRLYPPTYGGWQAFRLEMRSYWRE